MPRAEPHDGAYKLLFSHPLMVRELLEEFVRQDWVRRVDFTTLAYDFGTAGAAEREP